MRIFILFNVRLSCSWFFRMPTMLTVLCLSLCVHGLPRASSYSSSSSPKCVAKTFDELERSVYSLAGIKNVSPTVIIHRLLRKVKSKLERARSRNQLNQLALNELFHAAVKLPPVDPKTVVSESVPTREKPSIVGFLPPDNRLMPALTNPRIEGAVYPIIPGMTYSVDNLPGAQRVYLPAIGPPIFKPPPGVTIRVNPGGTVDGAFPDVTVTISPMMTVGEALRQADAKFRSSLGVPEAADDIVSIGYSAYTACYVINRFGDVMATQQHAWKIAVSDVRGNMIYDSICLPTRNEVPVKPGTTISLTYTVV